jgi:hypothetical protein
MTYNNVCKGCQKNEGHCTRVIHIKITCAKQRVQIAHVLIMCKVPIKVWCVLERVQRVLHTSPNNVCKCAITIYSVARCTRYVSGGFFY